MMYKLKKLKQRKTGYTAYITGPTEMKWWMPGVSREEARRRIDKQLKQLQERSQFGARKFYNGQNNPKGGKSYEFR